MNNRETYKRINVNWLLTLLIIGFYVFMIFVYVHQWGSRPITMTSLVILAVLWIVVFLFAGRFILTVDDEFFVFRSDLWTRCKIPIAAIKSVDVKQIARKDWYIAGKIIENHACDITWKAVVIELKNDKIYRVTLNFKNAQKIKEEIEKQITLNFKPKTKKADVA